LVNRRVMLKIRILGIAMILVTSQVARGSAAGRNVTRTADGQAAIAAVRGFLRGYLRHQGFPWNPCPECQRFLTLALRKRFAQYAERSVSWSQANPGLKPPFEEEFFNCGHNDPVSGYKIGGARRYRDGIRVHVLNMFGDRYQHRWSCWATMVVVKRGTVWQIDNVEFSDLPDLRTVLS
jgi:hypothetical protein